MLGRLAHWLRAMGYDTVYPGQVDDAQLLRQARAEGRLLLTRDAKLAEVAAGQGCLVRAVRLEQQLLEVVGKLRLAAGEGDWLSRCLDCNARLERVPKETVREGVPPRAFMLHEVFWACPGCRKLYWQGSHADRMLERLARVLKSEGAAG